MFSQHAIPIIVGPDGTPEKLQPSTTEYDEKWLQNLMFEHPEAIPIDEIDRSFTPAIPICTELRTQAGSIDALYVTPQGRLIILETKLWRNPEARREVIGQILDYAKELSRWEYVDLQREVSLRTDRSGNALFDIVAADKTSDRLAKTPDSLTEAEFADEVYRSLRQGRFLLLICGDGIREGVPEITDFLQRHGTLNFTFGLVEVAMYDMPEERCLIQPRILARSIIVKRTVVSLESEGLVATDEDEEGGEAEMTEPQRFYRDFWQEFIDDIELTDPDQPLSIRSSWKRHWVSFRMPSPGISVTLRFSTNPHGVGVYLGASGNCGGQVFEQLLEDKKGIEKDLNIDDVKWSTEDPEDETLWVESFKEFPGIKGAAYKMGAAHKPKIKEFFKDQLNRFVNVFRPRIKRIMEGLEG